MKHLKEKRNNFHVKSAINLLNEKGIKRGMRDCTLKKSRSNANIVPKHSDLVVNSCVMKESTQDRRHIFVLFAKKVSPSEGI